MDTRRYWPFPVSGLALESEGTRRQIAFFEQAERDGFRPYDHGSLVGALASSGRQGEMIPRSGLDKGLRRYWEVVLSDASSTEETVFIDGFENAADAVLLWLRGEQIERIRSGKEGCFVSGRSFAGGVARRSET